MRTTDPIGRWGPYDEQRRAAKRRAAKRRAALVIIGLFAGLAALLGIGVVLATVGVHVAP